MFLGRPLTLLRFDAPEYELARDHGKVSWRIRDGLLVARAGRGCGFLSLDVSHVGTEPDGRVKLRIEVEVANFYPAIAAGFSTPVYEATQSSIHVLVTHAFLRSLAKLDLAQSKVGRFAAGRAAGVGRGAGRDRARPPHPRPLAEVAGAAFGGVRGAGSAGRPCPAVRDQGPDGPPGPRTPSAASAQTQPLDSPASPRVRLFASGPTGCALDRGPPSSGELFGIDRDRDPSVAVGPATRAAGRACRSSTSRSERR